MGLRPQMLHETGNWVAITDCFNSSDEVNRPVALEEMGNFGPPRMLLVTECYDIRPAYVFFLMDSGETRTTTSSNLVQQGAPITPAMFWLAFRAGLKRCREEIEGERVGVSACIHDLSLGRMGVTANTVRATASPRMTSAL